jgi:endo-alpha-1,4-polygalactosaminidase (GH114 family)
MTLDLIDSIIERLDQNARDRENEAHLRKKMRAKIPSDVKHGETHFAIHDRTGDRNVDRRGDGNVVRAARVGM